MWTPAVLLLTAAAVLALLRPVAVVLGHDVRATGLAADGRDALGRLWAQRQTCPACALEVHDLSAHLADVHPVDEAVLWLGSSARTDFVLVERHPSSARRS